MKPTKIEGATRRLGAPSDWDEAKHGECQTIEVRDTPLDGGGNLVQTAWQPDEQERKAIAYGRPVILHIWGATMPPVALSVEPQPQRPLSNVVQGEFGRAMHDGLAAAAFDGGRPIEAGWEVMRDLLLKPDTTYAQLQDMKFAFFAGAQHLYATMMATMSPGSDITERDLKRMSNLHEELDAWEKEVRGINGAGKPS